MNIITKKDILTEIAGYPRVIGYLSDSMTETILDGIKYAQKYADDMDWSEVSYTLKDDPNSYTGYKLMVPSYQR